MGATLIRPLRDGGRPRREWDGADNWNLSAAR
jgi:hypothetical protein